MALILSLPTAFGVLSTAAGTLTTAFGVLSTAAAGNGEDLSKTFFTGGARATAFLFGWAAC